MATIRNTIALQNRMTPVLNSIVKSLDSTITALQRTGNASDAAFSEARGDIAEARRAIDSMNESLADTPEEIQEVNSGFTVMKGILANIGASILRNIGQALKRAVTEGIGYASDLLEVQNVVDKTFGNSAHVIDSWSKTALDAYGINTLSAKRYVGTMGAMLKASKVSGDQIAIMSTQLTGLAGDIASFYNIDSDAAFAKIQSGMAGEIRPLRDIGINMSVANLEAYALAQGIDTAFQKMDEASKAILRYNYLLSLTGDVQGDFADTVENFANQQRLLSENWLEFTGILAEFLLPTLTAVLSALNDIVTAMKPYAPVIMGAVVAVTALATAWGIYTAAQWLANLALWAFPGTWIIAAIILVIAALGAMVGWLMNLWKTNMEFRVGIIGIWNSILGFFDKVPVYFAKFGNSVNGVFDGIGVFVLGTMQDVANGTIDIINSLIEKLNKVPGVSMDFIDHASFGTQMAVQAEANKQARENDINQKIAQAEAKALGRENDLQSYIREQEAIEDGKSRQAAEEAKQTAAMEAMAADGVEISGGSLDSIKGDVKITDEDIKLLKDVAETEFINQFTTLRPELKVEFGEVTETADVGQLVEALEIIVEEAYGSALEEAG